MWITGGSYTDSSLQTIEVGVQTYPDKYGDSSPHLFIYSTSDAYQTTGCYNLDCSRFVQTNGSAPIGGAFEAPFSTAGGDQYEVEVEVQRDSDGNWWVGGWGEPFGYYPASLFDSSGIGTSASNLQVGGEIYGTRVGSRHSETTMGSGAYASAGYGYAGYHRDVRYVAYGYGFVNDGGSPFQFDSFDCFYLQETDSYCTAADWPDAYQSVSSLSTFSGDNAGNDTACYTASATHYSGGYPWNEVLYFGGPGYDAVVCP
jgi:hypothetical protein